MHFVKYLALMAGLALLLPISALAKNSNERSVNIPLQVKIGTAQLKPGTYKLEWQGTGPAVHVQFMQHNKTVARSQATLKTNDAMAFQDDVVTDPGAKTSKARVLREIDFAHDKDALIFPRKAM